MSRAVVLLVACLTLTSCVGTISRGEFDAEIESRGGGFDQSLISDAIDDVAAEVGTADFEILHLTATPGSAAVTMEVRDPRNPGQVDDYTFHDRSRTSRDPVQVSAGDDLDAEAFPISEFAVDDLNTMVDEALTAYDTEGGHVENILFVGVPDNENPDQRVGAIAIGLQSPRSSATAEFTPGGTFIGVNLQ